MSGMVKARKRKLNKVELEQQLENALMDTFPASDAVTVGDVDDKPDRPVDRRPPAIDKSLVDRLAQEVAEKRKA